MNLEFTRVMWRDGRINIRAESTDKPSQSAEKLLAQIEKEENHLAYVEWLKEQLEYESRGEQ
jgi:hypothetical protein